MPVVLSEHAYEILVLLAIEFLGGEAKRQDVLRLMEKEIMPEVLARHPEEQRDRESGAVITWQNKASFARKDLKNKGQLSMPEYGIWAITDAGRGRLRKLREIAPNPKALSVSALRTKVPTEKRAEFYAKLIEALDEFRDEI